ncbi:CLOCK-interacting pacemaker isoform X1 [Carassius gibelio]|uniref:CLOCK-interacting pacemaker isoform X1 n=1 Tax=Carassius gibelio TaxID=101364 RepID=UPI002277F6AD|nr:CLOCK-interacting pacemaker isoform X1 [Carassius gibelio]
MPKEPRGDAQGCEGEREHTSRPASKNAKDKNNSAALLASRARAHAEQETNGRDSRCSEKDSGYSDTGSDSLQTYADDQQSSVNEPQVHKGPLQGSNILVSGTNELTPIFIIKNVVLKQPGQSGQDHIIPSSLSWDGGATSSQAPTHVLLLQQPGVNHSTPLHILKPQPQRSESKGLKKSKNTYLPILNSYPRIAPHPCKKTPEKPTASRGSNTEEHSLSKRVCTEEKRDEVSTSTQAPKQHLHKKPENNLLLQSHSLPLSAGCETLSASHQHQSPCRPSSPSASLNVSSPSISSTQTLSPPSSNDLIQGRKEPHKHCPEPNTGSGKRSYNLRGTARQRRFLNTVEILSQLGLLDITLRTQDLLRQNAATERDIAQLRQQAHLLFQAAQAGADAPAAWEKLQQVMAESGHYPSLKCLPTDSSNGGSPSKVQVEAATSTKPDTPVVYRYGLNGTEEVAPPSPLLAPNPDAEWQSTGQYHFVSYNTTTSEQIRVYRGTVSPPDDPIMPPDSSTHGNLL